jgi:hypothetical protein
MAHKLTDAEERWYQEVEANQDNVTWLKLHGLSKVDAAQILKVGRG